MGNSEKATDEARAKARNVVGENQDKANEQMHGQRADLPAGTLRRPQQEPQADENRDQPVAPDGSLGTRSEPPPAP